MALYSDGFTLDGPEEATLLEVSLHTILRPQSPQIIFDSGASRCMSGVPGRIVDQVSPAGDLSIRGFNGAKESVTAVGLNKDGKMEYSVPGMPSNFVLLSAHEYAKDGMAVLFENDGAVIPLKESEIEQVRKFLNQFPATMKLIVQNRTYRVDENIDAAFAESDDSVSNAVSTAASSDPVLEGAYSSTATRYFNSKVNVSNNDERILSLLLSGHSFKDIYFFVQQGNIAGLPRDLTIQSLNNFERRYGRTPDIHQMATPDLAGNKKGYMAQKQKPQAVGSRVEGDILFAEFNEEIFDSETGSKKTVKLPTYGGAIAAYVTIDAFSLMPHGRCVKTVAETVDLIKETVDQYQIDGHRIELYAADMGILPQSPFRVVTSAASSYLRRMHIRIEVAEAYQHDHGTALIERLVREVKELIRFAVLYIIGNPNFKYMGWTKVQIFKLWGELFYWALIIISLKECPNVPGKTKYEVYYGRPPDLKAIRLLPIFSNLLVLRRTKNVELGSVKEFFQRGLYVGPSLITPGAIRVAVITRGYIRIVESTVYKAVNDGGDLTIHATINSHMHRLLSASDPTRTDANPAHNSTPVHDLRGDESARDSELRGDAVGKKKKKKRAQKRVKKLSEPSLQRVSTNSHTHRCDEDVTVEDLEDDDDDDDSDANPTIQQPTSSIHQRDQQVMQEQVKGWGTRAERASRRNAKTHQSLPIRPPTQEELLETLREEAMFADWSEHEEKQYYFSFEHSCFVVLENASSDDEVQPEESYRAVKEGVPKTLAAALLDPLWGDPARVELDTVTTSSGCIVPVDQRIAREQIANGAQVLRMIAVYEEKEKDGKLVRKVRLVADGRGHTKHGATYSSTPSREELFILLHVFASQDWDYYHVDEIRAFLNAPKQDQERIFVKFSGDPLFYEVLKALYGLKTAARDYQDSVATKLIGLGFERLHMSSCIYVKRFEGNKVIFIYDYVDDFAIGGNCKLTTDGFIKDFRDITSTTEPILNASKLLGMEIERNREKKIVSVTMKKRIEELAQKYPHIKQNRRVPMPTSGYLVRDHDFDNISEEEKRYLTQEEQHTYMSIVGQLIWIQGVRFDIIFAVLYLTWFTKQPRKHHLTMAEYVISYLINSKDLPLVLGGSSVLKIISNCDASLATGPKSRSIGGHANSLAEGAGAISAKASAQTTTRLSSFEAELDEISRAMKSISRIRNILIELGLEFEPTATLKNDNMATMAFVRGEGVAKGVRHMELRMWYTREQFKKNYVELVYEPSETLLADKLTKLGSVAEHNEFRKKILGLGLLD